MCCSYCNDEDAPGYEPQHTLDWGIYYVSPPDHMGNTLTQRLDVHRVGAAMGDRDRAVARALVELAWQSLREEDVLCLQGPVSATTRRD